MDWVLRRNCTNFWIVPFVQELLTSMFWRHQKMIIEAPKYRDNKTKQEYFINEFENCAMRIGTKRNVPYEMRLVFDETLWPPVQPDLYMHRALLYLKFSKSSEMFIFRLDFNKSIEEGVYIHDGVCALSMNFMHLNIFTVHFVENF